LLDDLVAAVLDGTAVDWASAESSANAAAKPIIRRLRLVASVADVHRRVSSLSADRTTEPPHAGTPASWGHLRLLEQIGHGAFGQVFRAWDTRLDREVALKLIPAGDSSDVDAGPSVLREGRLLAKVRHPNVATIYGAEQIGDRVGLWMELVRGQTLEELLKSGASFTPDEVVRIGRDLARAVAAVHAAGLLHRDIKAQNVMRDDEGRVVLMDFGTGLERTRSSPDVAGTPLYLPPEVLAGGPASEQSDVYGLGVLLFRLLTGTYPIVGASVHDVRDAHERGRRKRVREVRKDRSRRLARVVDRAIDPRLHVRYDGAEALAAALEPLSRESRRRRTAYALAVTGCVALIGLSWHVMSRRTDVGGRQSVAEFRLGPPTSPWWSAPRAASRPVIAVLPIGRRGREDPLADGLTYELRDRLAAVEGLAVVGAASAFEFGQSSASLVGVHDQLGADFVVEGEPQRSTRGLRFTMRLVRTADSVTLWSEVFETEPGRLSWMPDEVARAIVDRLSLRPGRDQRRAVSDPDAYLEYLTARGRLARYFHQSEEVARLFESAVTKDPSFARGWAGLAAALGWSIRLKAPGETPPDIEAKLRHAALEAIRLDPELAEAHAAIGGLRALDGEWAEAEASFARALELNPSLTETHTDAALLLLFPLGRFDHALELLELAREINPLSLHVHRVVACMQVESGRPNLYDDAIRTARWAIERDPELEWTDVCLARALMLTGDLDGADRVLRARPQYWYLRGYLLAIRGLHAEARAIADAHPEAPARRMLIHAGLGELDRAFDLLEQVSAVNRWRAATWMQWPEIAMLRADPRYAELRKRLGVLD
jgi:serine/threonine-protein kinase